MKTLPVGINNRSRFLAGRATDFLREHGYEASGDHCLRTPKEAEPVKDSDGAIDTDCAFDLNQHRHRDDSTAILQALNVKEFDNTKGIGFQTGFVGRQEKARQRTARNWWVFDDDCIRQLHNKLATGPRPNAARKRAGKAIAILHDYYKLSYTDAEISREHPLYFPNEKAAKEFRRQIFREGCQLFGERQIEPKQWRGRSDASRWKEFRQSCEQSDTNNRLENRQIRKEQGTQEPTPDEIILPVGEESEREHTLSTLPDVPNPSLGPPDKVAHFLKCTIDGCNGTIEVTERLSEQAKYICPNHSRQEQIEANLKVKVALEPKKAA